MNDLSVYNERVLKDIKYINTSCHIRTIINHISHLNNMVIYYNSFVHRLFCIFYCIFETHDNLFLFFYIELLFITSNNSFNLYFSILPFCLRNKPFFLCGKNGN